MLIGKIWWVFRSKPEIKAIAILDCGENEEPKRHQLYSCAGLGHLREVMSILYMKYADACAGPCQRCGVEHALGNGPALDAAMELMARLERCGRIDWDAPAPSESRLSTYPLFGHARGQMFGVMVYRDAMGVCGVSKAFSGQFNGMWKVPGWAPPLLDVALFAKQTAPIEREIKRLGRRMNALPVEDALRLQLTACRRELSRQLMAEIHALYRIPNFRGQVVPLDQAFLGKGIPTGTADCCAPKLLGLAATNGWKPLGIAEFYWGRENRSGTRVHGNVYRACREKCRPILGFMLCGLEEVPVV